MNFIKEAFEKNRTETKEMKENIPILEDKVVSADKHSDTLESNLDTLNHNFRELKNRHFDLEARSMRGNLLFTRFYEPEGEYTEETLKCIMRQEMNLQKDFSFERVPKI